MALQLTKEAEQTLFSEIRHYLKAVIGARVDDVPDDPMAVRVKLHKTDLAELHRLSLELGRLTVSDD